MVGRSVKHRHTISLSHSELTWLTGILDHFTDYMAFDDRPDHGLARLKWFREDAPSEVKQTIYYLAGRLEYMRRKCKSH